MERAYIKGDQPVPGYRLAKFLGRGGFGEVWKATGPGGIEVALKVIGLDNKQGFKEFRAIRIVKNVRHAHLVPIQGFWLKDSAGGIFDDSAESDSFLIKGKATELIIAMGLGEYSLMDRLEEYKKEGRSGIPADELLNYMEGAARAIDYLNRPVHSSGSGHIAIQHCDVKPQNIMVVGGEAALCDFGLARVLGETRTTQSNNMMSVPYTCPEMFSETKPSHASDQYALAVTYVELRTGELPFENANNPAGLIWQIMQGKIDLARLPAAEAEVVRRATALDPAQRFPSSLDMVKELRRAVEGVPSTPSRPKGAAGPEGPGTEIVPGYKLRRRLGQGGYGTVWEAQAPGGKSVAIKIIHNVDGMSGRQEFRALELIKSLEHEHLLDLHAYWLLTKEGEVIPDEARHRPDAPPANTLVIATKLASKNLLQLLGERQQEGHAGIPVTELLHYIRQAAQAIDFLNEPLHLFNDQLVSIQHRDIKPENILLVRDTVKVGDFGLAKVLEGTTAQVHGNSTGYTPYYAAPELFDSRVSRWTDQYSLAVTYFKLRTGQLPFDANNISPGGLISLHLEGKLDFSALSEAERGVIVRATALTPGDRYPTCLDMVTALERALSSELRLAPVGGEPKTVVPTAEATAPVAPRQGATALKPKTDPDPFDRTVPPLEEVFPDLGRGMDTMGPRTDTPAPKEAAPAAWKEQPKKKAPTREEAPAAAEGKGWQQQGEAGRVSRRRKKGPPVGVLVMVLLLAGGAVGAGAWLVIGGLKPPATGTSGNPTHASTGNGSSVGNTDRQGTKPVDTGRGDNDPGRLMAKLRGAFAKDPEGALELADKARANPAANAQTRSLAALVKAHALARQSKWDEVQRELPGSDMPPDLKPLQKALVFLARPPREINAQVEGKTLADLLREAGGLRREGLTDAWTTNQLKARGDQAAGALKGRVVEATRQAPDKLDGIEPALVWAKELGEYDSSQYAALAGDQRAEAVKVLRQAAQGLPKRPNPNHNPLTPPWAEKDAGRAYDYLKLASALVERAGGTPAPDLRKDLALAAMTREEPDPVLACKLLEDYDPRPGTREDVPYLLAKAQAQPATSPKGRRTAFEFYARTWGLIKGDKVVRVEDQYEKVLQPAIDNGEKIARGEGAAFQKRLADCYRAKAKLIGDYPGMSLWPDWKRDRMVCYEQVARLDPGPESLLELSRRHQEWAMQLAAKSPDQREYLLKALADADQALAGHEKPGLVQLQRGQVLFDLGKLDGKKERFTQAIDAFTKALASPAPVGGEQKAQAYFDLGSAYLWLIIVYQVDPANYSKVRSNMVAYLRLAEKEGVYDEKKRKDAFAALYNAGNDYYLNKKKDYATAADWFKELTDRAAEAKDEFYTSWGLRGLFDVGRAYEGQNKPDEALAVYQRGLPADVKRATPVHLRLLTARTQLFLNPKFAGTLKAKRDLTALLEDAKRGVELAAAANSPWVENALKAEAYGVAAVCYLRDGQKDKGYQHFDKAIELAPTDEWKKLFRDQMKQWKERSP